MGKSENRGILARLLAIAAGFVLALALVGALEGFFYYMNTYHPSATPVNYFYSNQDISRNCEGAIPWTPVAKEIASPLPRDDSYAFHPEMIDDSNKFPKTYAEDGPHGWVARPNQRVESILRTKTGEGIYDVHYTIDPYRRRFVPQSEQNRASKEALLFLGDSFVFGEGNEDNQTLPYFAAKYSHRFEAYDFGFHGYGPNNLLAWLQERSFTDGVTQKRAIAVYIYIDAHLSRLIGPMSHVTTWGGREPYYHLDDQGHVVRTGNFQTGRPFLTWLYGLLSKSQIVKYFHVDFPPRPTRAHYDLMAKTVLQMKQEFESKFSSDGFYFVFYPGNNGNLGLCSYLRKYGISVIDYSGLDLNRYLNVRSTLRWDAHPSAAAHEFLAKQLIHDLHLR